MTNTVSPPQATILVNVVPDANKRQFIYSNSLTIDTNISKLSCLNNTNFNRNNFYGVFFFDIKFMSSD